MASETEFAYLTGGASGIGAATARMLASKGIKVFIADRDAAGAEAIANEIGGNFGVLDVASWDDQAKVFSQAVAWAGRIQYVFAIAGVGERRWLPQESNSAPAPAFHKPDLSAIDINLNGLLYTCGLAVQQGRRQSVDKNGFKMKINVVASVCGMYCCPTIPVYTAAKHGVTGFVRSYGKYLPSENMTLNAVMPNVARTNISNVEWYDELDGLDLLTPVDGVVAVFESWLYDNNDSGRCVEVGPNYAKGQGFVDPKFTDFVDEESEKIFALLEERNLYMQVPE